MHVLVFFTLFLVSTASYADTLHRRVVRVVDGDTLVVLDSNNVQHRVRLGGIDTPERGQPFGNRAKQNLARLAGGQDARVE